MIENNKRPSQCDRIIKYLNDFGSITQLEALQDLGIMRLASRMHNLRKSGYIINGQICEVKNRYGEICRIKKYKLGEENEWEN